MELVLLWNKALDQGPEDLLVPAIGFQVIWELHAIGCMISYLCALFSLQFSEISVPLEK